MNDSEKNYPIIGIDSYEAMFLALGSDRVLDCLYVFMLTPVCGIGFILNILSFVVFMDKEFDKVPFFSFLRVYTVNSSVLLLAVGSFFIANASRFLTWTYSYPAQLLFVHIAAPLGNTCYYFGTMLDLVLTLNRIAIFRKPVKKLFVLGPYKLCAAILAFCAITEIPYYIYYKIEQYIVYVVDSAKLIRVYLGIVASFGWSDAAITMVVLLELWRDLFLTLVVIAVNIWLVYCFKAYLKQRAALMHGGLALATPVAVVAVNPAPVTVETVNNGAATSSTTVNQVKKNTQPAPGTTGQQGEVSSADLRSTIMAIVVCALTTCEHIALFFNLIYPYINPNRLPINYFSLSSTTITALKHTVNFFVFYFFNKKFAEKLHNMFRC
jgi:hypothetical protein